PIFGLLHEQSTAVNVLRESRAGVAVTFSEEKLPAAAELASGLAAFARDSQYFASEVRWDAFEGYSARNSARALAILIGNALELFEKRRTAGNIRSSVSHQGRSIF